MGGCGVWSIMLATVNISTFSSRGIGVVSTIMITMTIMLSMDPSYIGGDT